MSFSLLTATLFVVFAVFLLFLAFSRPKSKTPRGLQSYVFDIAVKTLQAAGTFTLAFLLVHFAITGTPYPGTGIESLQVLAAAGGLGAAAYFLWVIYENTFGFRRKK